MTTDLRRELERIAGDTAARSAPPDLWRRGLRRRRRARVRAVLGTAVAVVLVVAAGAGGHDLLRRPPAQPAGGDGAAAIPSRLVTPSRWTGGTAGHPPGRLAVIAGAERADGWWDVSSGVVAVSAATGTYRFLDLPDAFEDPADAFVVEGYPVLSPDGRHVAYWTRQPQRAERVGGVAVYDTVSGEVLRHDLPSALGLVPERLEWAGDDGLVVGYGTVTDWRSNGWSSSAAASFLWRPGSDGVVDLSEQVGSPDDVSPTDSGFAVTWAGRLELRFGPTAAVDRVVRLSGRGRAVDSTVDPTARTMVRLPPGNGGAVRRLLVGTVGAKQVRFAPLAVDLDMTGLLGWQDPQHVVVRGRVPGDGRQRVGAYAVDLRTAEARLLVREERVPFEMSPAYAGELWSVSPTDRPEPSASDPRLLAGGGALAALLAAVVLELARRRRRAG